MKASAAGGALPDHSPEGILPHTKLARSRSFHRYEVLSGGVTRMTASPRKKSIGKDRTSSCSEQQNECETRAKRTQTKRKAPAPPMFMTNLWRRHACRRIGNYRRVLLFHIAQDHVQVLVEGVQFPSQLPIAFALHKDPLIQGQADQVKGPLYCSRGHLGIRFCAVAGLDRQRAGSKSNELVLTLICNRERYPQFNPR